MRVINVILIEKGIISQVESFLIVKESDTQTMVEKAENAFCHLIECKLGTRLSEEDEEYHIENGSYDNGNGYEVCLTWSEPKVHQVERSFEQKKMDLQKEISELIVEKVVHIGTISKFSPSRKVVVIMDEKYQHYRDGDEEWVRLIEVGINALYTDEGKEYPLEYMTIGKLCQLGDYLKTL